jgi:hypothetical protein
VSNPFAIPEAIAKANPANAPEKRVARRIPLALPTLKLETPEIPGYKLHWFRGTAGRIQQALNAGYEYVERDEIQINHHGLADDYEKDGNSDLGTRVSQPAGDTVEGGVRLYLMKIRQEFWDEDQKLVDGRHEAIANSLRRPKASPMDGGDTSNTYSRGESHNLFNPRPRAR